MYALTARTRARRVPPTNTARDLNNVRRIWLFCAPVVLQV